MSRSRYVVLSFRKKLGHLTSGNMQEALSAESAMSRARAMAPRCAGVAVCEAHYDEFTGGLMDPKILLQLGDVPCLESV